MARRTFADIVKSAGFDIQNEYSKLYELMYCQNSYGCTLERVIAKNFMRYNFRGLCLTFEEFNRTNEFDFMNFPEETDIDKLVSFMEYMYNLVMPLPSDCFEYIFDKRIYIDHIKKLLETINYDLVREGKVYSFVPRNNVAISVAELEFVPQELSYKVLLYDHHSMKGAIAEKRAILVGLANVLEPKRKILNSVNSSFCSDLFQLINSCNIRHNNIDKASKNYQEYIASLDEESLEEIYDAMYQMILLAFMEIDNFERKDWLKQLKERLN